MSVTEVVKNGKACWQVQVIRGGKRIRRYLDRKTSLRRDALALERELRAGLDAAKEGGEDQEEREMGPAPAWAGPGGVRASESPWTSVGASPGASVPSAARARANASADTPTRRDRAPQRGPSPDAGRPHASEAARANTPATGGATCTGEVGCTAWSATTGWTAGAVTSPTTVEAATPSASAPTTPPTTPATPTTSVRSRGRRRAPKPTPAASPHASPGPAAAPTPAPTPAGPTFGEFAERFLALQDPTRSDYRNKVRNVRKHLVPVLGKAPLRTLNRAAVDDLRIRLREPGTGARSYRSAHRKEAPVSGRRWDRPRSAKTINNVMATLRAILHLALDYEAIDRMPRIVMEPEAKKEPAFLDVEETERLLEAAGPEWRGLFLVAVRTGLRRGELLELRWKDVHLEGTRPQIRVSRSVRLGPGKAATVKEPKGRRGRSVPLSPSVHATLRALREASGGPLEELVFGDREEGGYIDYRRYYHALAKTAKAAGIVRHVHPHMLRHTFASHCYMRRVPPQVVQKWLGHASVTTTERYAHLRPEVDDELIRVVDPEQPTTGDPAPRGAENSHEQGVPT